MAIINPNFTELVCITEKAGAKRIKISDIDVTKRATKGVLIAKKNKTNPHAVRYCISANLSDDLQLFTDEGHLNVMCRDISLMNKEARFSNPLTNRIYYHVAGLPEVRIVDIPPEAEMTKSYEEVGLEV